MRENLSSTGGLDRKHAYSHQYGTGDTTDDTGSALKLAETRPLRSARQVKWTRRFTNTEYTENTDLSCFGLVSLRPVGPCAGCSGVKGVARTPAAIEGEPAGRGRARIEHGGRGRQPAGRAELTAGARRAGCDMPYTHA